MNETYATSCAQCNFPLLPHSTPVPEPAAEPHAPEPAAPAGTPGVEAGRGFDPSIRRMRPIRPRPPRGPQAQLQMQLWLVLGSVAVLLVLFTAYQGFRKNNTPAPVEGAKEDQQHMADMARAELAKDSTNVNARILLANVLYDTGNWSEAIIHYKAARARDPKRIETLVDLGVCYYNLSHPDEAMGLFKEALALEPDHPIALFNMGIVAEGQGRMEDALKYYHHALQSHPPEGMGEPLQQAIQRVMAKLGRTAPPIEGTSGGGKSSSGSR
jgi:tetratricopeptide (TPR) repeat protein